VWIFWNGGYPLFALLALLTFIGQWELFAMPGHELSIAHRVVGYLAGIGIISDAFLFHSVDIAGILVAALIILFGIEILVEGTNRLKRITFSFLGTAYPAVFVSYLFMISQYRFSLFGSDNRFLLVYLIIVVWVFDTASYFSGMNFGRHPFFPSVSPKKTVEGFIGGLAGVVLFGGIVGFAAGFSAMQLIIVSLLAGFAGQAGDLSESIIKRDMGIKDSSQILPGHGGILDRFDSVFFAAPVIYGYLVLCSLWRGGSF
jgi:phosphatidate cytidylyltransferase